MLQRYRDSIDQARSKHYEVVARVGREYRTALQQATSQANIEYTAAANMVSIQLHEDFINGLQQLVERRHHATIHLGDVTSYEPRERGLLARLFNKHPHQRKIHRYDYVDGKIVCTVIAGRKVSKTYELEPKQLNPDIFSNGVLGPAGEIDVALSLYQTDNVVPAE